MSSVAPQSKALIDDLKWRGLFSQSTDEAALVTALSKPTTLYIGFDPNVLHGKIQGFEHTTLLS